MCKQSYYAREVLTTYTPFSAISWCLIMVMMKIFKREADDDNADGAKMRSNTKILNVFLKASHAINFDER